jgi:hypothetical protein
MEILEGRRVRRKARVRQGAINVKKTNYIPLFSHVVKPRQPSRVTTTREEHVKHSRENRERISSESKEKKRNTHKNPKEKYK